MTILQDGHERANRSDVDVWLLSSPLLSSNPPRLCLPPTPRPRLLGIRPLMHRDPLFRIPRRQVRPRQIRPRQVRPRQARLLKADLPKVRQTVCRTKVREKRGSKPRPRKRGMRGLGTRIRTTRSRTTRIHTTLGRSQRAIRPGRYSVPNFRRRCVWRVRSSLRSSGKCRWASSIPSW